MTVKELIAKLQAVTPDDNVYVAGDNDVASQHIYAVEQTGDEYGTITLIRCNYDGD